MADLPEGIRRAFRLALRRPRVEEEVQDEVEFHLQMRVAEMVARGWTEDAARAEAQRRFGNTEQWRQAMSEVDMERVAQQQRTEWLDDLRKDIRFAIRSLGRAPLFTLLSVVTLAVGIGANTAVFGVLKSVLLDSLPFADADRLVRVYGRRTDGTFDRAPISGAAVERIRERQHSFSSLAAFMGGPQDGVLMVGGEPRLIQFTRVEPSIFPTLGVIPAMGRLIQEADAATDTVWNVMMSYPAWQKFGADPNVVGSRVTLNNIPRTVIGVLPRSFVPLAGDADFYYPLNLPVNMRDPVTARRRHWLGVVGRLKPGVTVKAAEGEAVRIMTELSKEFPLELGSSGVHAMSLRNDLAGDTRTPLIVLMASAAFVLIITCANLAGAMLSRTLTRRKEFAIRAALGAGSGRLVRQLLTESTLLGMMGGVAGVLLAAAGLRLIRGFASNALPAYANLSLDPGVLAITGALALLTGIAFGAAPAISVGRSDPQSALREETRGASESRRSRQLRGLLVAGQIALSVSLLAGAALLARSLWAMTAAPLGFNPDGLLTASVYLNNQRYGTGEARTAFTAQFEERLRALPGVIDVASTGETPTRIRNKNAFWVQGVPPLAADATPLAVFVEVSDSYFRTLGIQLRAGRTFGAEETPNAPPSLIINEGMAKRYWPNGNALGGQVKLDPTRGPTFTVVGIVADVRNDPVRATADPVLYLSNRQHPWNGPAFLIRTQRDPRGLEQPVRRALAEIDPALPLHSVSPMRDLLGDTFAGRRLPVMLMTAFGALALLLASVGVYAMFAAMAAAREREFAVRMALGSSKRAIAGLVIQQGAVWMTLGLAVGVVGVFAVTRSLRTLLFGVGPFDPVALGLSLVLLIACGTIALLVPVRRATQADPISVLR